MTKHSVPTNLEKPMSSINQRARRGRRAVLAAIAILGSGGAAHADEFTTVIATGEVTAALQQLDAPAAGDTHTLDNHGTIQGATPTGTNTLVVQAEGQGRVVINNHGRIQGRVDFSGLNGGVTFNNLSGGTGLGWALSGNATIDASVFSSGDDVLYNGEGATITLGLSIGGARVYFGEGYDRLENNGTITATSTATTRPTFYGLEEIRNTGSLTLGFVPDLEVMHNTGALTITVNALTPNLRTLTNTGTLLMAEPSNANGAFQGARIVASQVESFHNDGLIDMFSTSGSYRMGNRLILPGAAFVAGENSHLIVNALLDGGFQDYCTAQPGEQQSDCMSVAGGSTSGVTRVTVHGIVPDQGNPYAGAFSRMGVAVVDVSGGSSAAGHFVLDPDSPGFDVDAPFGGGIRASEFFTYHLLYDGATQVHRLVGLPDSDFYAFGALPLAVHQLWRTGHDAAAARQVELRSDAAKGGVWVKGSGSDTDHESVNRISIFGLSSDVRVGYSQDATAFSVGGDVMGGEGDSRHAFGISLGSANSTVDFDGSLSRAKISGMAINLYGSYRQGAFFLDLSGGGFIGDLEGRLQLQSSSTRIDTDANAFGAHVESGWHVALTERLSLQPMASLAYVRSGLGDIENLPGHPLNGLLFDVATSFRGGVGARAMFDVDLAAVKLNLSLTGRVWEEFEGDASMNVRTRVDAVPVSTGLSGTFSEVAGSLGLSALDGALSGYLSFGGQFGDDYDSTTASLGLRYNW